MKRVEALALAALLSTSGRASTEIPDDHPAQEAIRDANSAFCENVRTRNVTHLVNDFYAPGAMLLPPGRAAITGRDGIRSYWKSVLGSGDFELELTTDRVEESSELAYEVGRYTLYSKQESGPSAIADHGKYVVNWKRMENGAWRAVADIFNSSGAMK